ncbi:hypothetical protein, partial [Enterobacter hormaechei]|uniref:hypothetical protein n=1 Tax=Enterobacter hormaechei TaxID=158836 RepID=UPI0023E15F48
HPYLYCTIQIKYSSPKPNAIIFAGILGRRLASRKELCWHYCAAASAAEGIFAGRIKEASGTEA